MIRTRLRWPLALLLTAALALIATGCGDDDSGSTTAEQTTPAEETTTTSAETATAEMTLTSSAYADGDELPVDYTCDGAGSSPPLEIGGVPDEAAELVLVFQDPDAPGGTFFHATAYGIAPDTTSVPEGNTPPGAKVGANDGGGGGFFPACPPPGDDPHSYVFTVYALGEESGLGAGAAPADVVAAAESAEIGSATLTATYGR